MDPRVQNPVQHRVQTGASVENQAGGMSDEEWGLGVHVCHLRPPGARPRVLRGGQGPAKTLFSAHFGAYGGRSGARVDFRHQDVRAPDAAGEIHLRVRRAHAKLVHVRIDPIVAEHRVARVHQHPKGTGNRSPAAQKGCGMVVRGWHSGYPDRKVLPVGSVTATVGTPTK